MKSMVMADAAGTAARRSWMRGFLAWNRKLSDAVTPAHYADTHGIVRFHDVCLQQMCRNNVFRVLDVGAGKA